ncbi:MAG: hypothetical protein EBX37_06115, partial [Alphaproteobacteria bacterium]|nr:hypothetical protein [Alphaproteobacteria bacterium]
MQRPLPAIYLCAIAALVGLLAGCATPPPASDPEALAEYRATNDPAEPFNRAMFDVHQAIDSAILRPLNGAYRWLPTPVRHSVSSVLNNLRTPVVLLNDMLQGEPVRAGDTLGRFVINTTLGLDNWSADGGSVGHTTNVSYRGIGAATLTHPTDPTLYGRLVYSPSLTLSNGVSYLATAKVWQGYSPYDNGQSFEMMTGGTGDYANFSYVRLPLTGSCQGTNWSTVRSLITPNQEVASSLRLLNRHAPQNSTYVVDDSADKVIEAAAEGVDWVIATVDQTLGANVENLDMRGTGSLVGIGNELGNIMYGSASGTKLDGGDGNDSLYGRSADTDTLLGGAGNDYLDGGAGGDIMNGGTGNDTYRVDSASDKVTESANEGVDWVLASVDYTLGEELEGLQLQGIDNLKAIGNELNNSI